MAMTTRTKINRETLWKIINEQCGGNATAFDKSIGRSNGYSHNYKPGRKVNGKEMLDMANTDILLIKALYGVDITLKEETKGIEIKDEKPIVSEDFDYDQLAKSIASVIDYDKLSSAIYKAVYGGIINAKRVTIDNRVKE